MKKNKKTNYTLKIFLGINCSMAVTLALLAIIYAFLKDSKAPEEIIVTTPKDVLSAYVSLLKEQNFKKMYTLLDKDSRSRISEDAFILRNQKIYEGIEAKNFHSEITDTSITSEDLSTVTYTQKFESLAGEIHFTNTATFTKDKEGKYTLSWDDSMIFPQLTSGDKVKVIRKEAKRGRLLDRVGNLLAGEGAASSVGLVPGKLSEDWEKDRKQLSRLLNMTPESIEKKLQAKWVNNDSFVPLKTIEELDESELLSSNPSEKAMELKEQRDSLLQIPGIMITDIAVRSYPLEEKASHLTGYVQNVTAEDLKDHPGEGYYSNSLIGRTGLESLYEKELRGSTGYEILITDFQGAVKCTLASVAKKDGEDIRLTIDSELQSKLYDSFREDRSCSVALNPYTGEVLALVSTPSYNSNDFILGMSADQWETLNQSEAQPLYNRFRQTWCPGSSFKPIIAAIGLTSGALDPEEDYGQEGLKWRNDASWGNYYVTTLHTYDRVTLENALIHSDNIYFAKAALKIGKDKLAENLSHLGFSENLPFEISLSSSQYARDGIFQSEIQLADTGYGQGEVLVNPLHLACLYTAFCNKGDVISPTLLYQEEAAPRIWIKNAFSEAAAEIVRNALLKTVNTPAGTGYTVHRKDLSLAGKTGTAEIKLSKTDNQGTELGWFAVFTTDKDTSEPILLVTMVEDVKQRGGSSYVMKGLKPVLEHLAP